MKIGVFTDSYKPYTSGVVTSITTFKEELNRLGHEIYIFAPNYPHYEEKEEGVYRFFSLPAPTNRDFTLAIPVHPGLNLLVKRLDLDVIHVHSPFTMGRVGLHYARKYQIPLLFTYHTRYDQYVHYVPLAQDFAKEVALKYSNSFCNHCDHVIVPSSQVKDIIKNYGVKTPITVMPTGVPVHKFQGVEPGWLREHYEIPEKNRILLFVGRLSREKNLDFLIRAFNKVRETMPDTTLVITAQGPLEMELKSLVIELGMSLTSQVIFTGALPFESLIKVYHSADLFVFASVTETQGLVLTEAMAAGLPVVAVNASGVNDMVDNRINGLLTSCDIEEFSQAIGQVLTDNKLYQKLKNNALIKADKLSSANMAIKLEQLYEHLVNSNPRRPFRMMDVTSWFGS